MYVHAGLIRTQSIKIQPSTISYIAKSVVLVGTGEKHKAYRACNIMFAHSHSSHINFLLLIKVRVPSAPAWLPSDHRVSRLLLSLQLGCDIPPRQPHCCGMPQYNMLTTDIITNISTRHIAYMHLLGNSHMESGDYKSVIESFERAQAQM